MLLIEWSVIDWMNMYWLNDFVECLLRKLFFSTLNSFVNIINKFYVCIKFMNGYLQSFTNLCLLFTSVKDIYMKLS